MYNDKTPPFSSGLWLKTAVLGPQTAVFPESLEKRYLTRISCVFVVLGVRMRALLACRRESWAGPQLTGRESVLRGREGKLGWP